MSWVQIRRLNGRLIPELRKQYGTRGEAEAAALAINCKPFSPFFAAVITEDL